MTPYHLGDSSATTPLIRKKPAVRPQALVNGTTKDERTTGGPDVPRSRIATSSSANREPRGGNNILPKPAQHGQARLEARRIGPSSHPSDAWGALWWTRIPGRMWKVLVAMTMPIHLLVAILDGLVAAAIVGLLVLVWAWWTHIITDDQVAAILNQVGQRGLAIMLKAAGL